MTEHVQPLLDELRRMTAPTNAEPSVRAVLDVYVQAVGELRGVAREARGRIERAAAAVADAREFARRRRKRAAKRARRAADGAA